MANVTILHLSDLHWHANKSRDAEIVIDALVKDIKLLKSERGLKPDFIVFSGDLVQAGEDAGAFDSVREAFLQPVLDAACCDPSQLFIAPGNHDISRAVVRSASYVEIGLKNTLTSVDAVNKFIDDLKSSTEANELALRRTKNFYTFHDSFIASPPIRSAPLLRTYTLNIDGFKVGIACFNTAWRATGEDDQRDKNNMIFGERNVDDAIANLSDTDLRIAVFHHPFEWLDKFDEVAIESRLYSQFDILFCGHIHRARPELRTTAMGSSLFSQAGCLYQSRSYFNGYHFVHLNIDTQEVEFTVRTYQDSRRVFDAAVNIARDGLVGLRYQGRNTSLQSASVELFLRETRPFIRSAANDQINIRAEKVGKFLDAKEAFVPPPRLHNGAPTLQMTIGRSRPAQMPLLLRKFFEAVIVI